MSEKEKLVLLMVVNDDMKLNLIKNMLDKNDIPAYLKDLGISGYMRIITGTTIYGTEIYVRESDLEKAVDAVNAIEKEDSN